MPRKGMGQKVSSVPGQTYGARAEQEASQAVQPMAEMAPPPTPKLRPGDLGVSLTGSTTRPSEPISAPLGQIPQSAPPLDLDRYKHMAATFRVLSGMPTAGPALRMMARKMRMLLPDEEAE